MPSSPALRFPWLACLLIAVAGCSAEGDPPGGSCSSSAECETGYACIDGRCTEVPDGGGVDGHVPGVDAGDPADREVVSITIDPPSADLVSTDGSMPTQDFEVIATLRDGTTRPAVAPRFELDSLRVGDVSTGSGLFTANGAIGGTATVTATVIGADEAELTSDAVVSVRLERTVFAPDAPADAPDRFTDPPAADPSRAADLVYPLDGAVLPQNAYPADVQWLRGDAGDIFRVTLDKPHVTAVGYVAHTGSGFQNDWLVDADAWAAVAQTDPDADATVTVDRWIASSSEAIAGEPVTIRFARAALTGSVYYWDIAAGRIIRIDDGTAMRESFMPSPPVAMDGARCVGCHTVSNSGRYMAGRLGGGENIGAVFDLTADLSGDPPPTEFPLRTTSPTSQRWWFSSWSPDDTRMVISTAEGSSRQMRIMDPFTGSLVSVSGTLPSNITHPAWSPDGDSIAYAANVSSWGGTFTTGDIATIDVTGPDAFGASRVIHDGASLAGDSPGGTADSYPTWTPDSGRIAFAHGTGSRSEDQQAALYIMNRDGSDVIRLDRVNGSTTDNFQPRFSPFDSGGYFWMSFLSRRDYGNSLAGTRGSGLQQIWVTAIRKGSAPGEDPSEVPYWLPGQSTGSRNISAYWAPRPCRPDGEECSVGSECCGGDCRPDASGTLVCSPPPPERCRNEGETCTTTADCCEGMGLECIANVCTEAPG